MSKKKLLLLFTTLLLITISGCFPTGEIRHGGNSELSPDAQQIADNIKNFELDLTLPEKSPENLPMLELHIKEWDTDKVLGLLVGDEEITQRDEYDSDHYAGEKYTVYQNDNMFLSIEKGRLGYNRKTNYSQQITSALDSCYYTEPYDINCSFATREEVAAKFKELLNALGITNLSEPDVKAVNPDFANRILRETAPSGKFTPWTDEEIYYINFSQVYEGVPVSNYDIIRHNGEGYVSMAAKISAVFDKTGIIKLSFQNIKTPEYKKLETVSVTPPENALKTVVNHFASQKLLRYHTMFDCELIYADVSNNNRTAYTLIPVWQFTYRTAIEGIKEQNCHRIYADNRNRLILQ